MNNVWTMLSVLFCASYGQIGKAAAKPGQRDERGRGGAKDIAATPAGC